MMDAQKVILRVLEKMGKPVNSTRLVKLVYLIDYTYYQFHGKTLTGFEYMWDHHGPNAVGHAIVNEANNLAKRSLVNCSHSPNIYNGITSDYRILPTTKVERLTPIAEMIVADIIRRYGQLNANQITYLSKQTEPFKSAKQYSTLHMKQIGKVEGTTAEDYKRYKEQEEKLGLASLDEVRAMA